MFNGLTGFITQEPYATVTPTQALGFMLLFILMIIAMIGIYIYTSFALMKIAKKTNTKNPWLAWIPVGNLVLIANIAQMHWWPILLIIPTVLTIIIASVSFILGATTLGTILFFIYVACAITMTVYISIWQWKMFKAVNRPGWWAIITLVVLPIYGVLMFMNIKIIAITLIILSTLVYLVLLGVAAFGNNSNATQTEKTYSVKKVKKASKKK